jgi:hypothetical protein
MLPVAILGKRTVAAVAVVSASALLIGVVIAVRSWLAAHDASVHLAATIEVQEQILAQAVERQRQRNAALSATLAEISRAKRRVNTPAAAVAEIPQLLPALPEPFLLELPMSTPAEPEPPATAIIPQPDLKPIYDYLQDCRACQASLSVARKDLADERAKLDAVTHERDAAIRAVRGGGFWTRLRGNSKWFVIGAAAGALAATLSR